MLVRRAYCLAVYVYGNDFYCSYFLPFPIIPISTHSQCTLYSHSHLYYHYIAFSIQFIFKLPGSDYILAPRTKLRHFRYKQ